jgi:hypothetical protein
MGAARHLQEDEKGQPMNDSFWAAIDAQLKELTNAACADDVIRILGGAASSGDAFFAGSGGDGSVEGALDEAGWTHAWREAHYHWAMRSPNGDGITYVEGDIYRGVQKPPL